MALVTSGVVPDWPGLQHELHIIVPFLFLFPSVLLLPDVIRFSNLDAQTHQEPQNTHTEKKKRLETTTQVPTHTHQCYALPTDSSVMPVTLAAQTYVVLTHVQPACNFCVWDSHCSTTDLINLSGLQLPYILYRWSETTGTSACQEQSLTYMRKPQLSLLYIPFTSFTKNMPKHADRVDRVQTVISTLLKT